MKLVNRMASFLIISLMCFSLFSPSIFGVTFQEQRNYSPGIFSDINENAWYGYNKQKVISKVYELGLMEGKGKNFDPASGITLAEAITMASRVRNIYEGGSFAFENTSPWYKIYLDYALEKEIIKEGDFAKLDQKASRSEMAYIFSNALPAKEYEGVNTVESLPDVTTATKYRDSIFNLYRAGILTGNDEYGSFSPKDTITRAEAAAIIARVALKEERKTFTLKEKDIETRYVLFKDIYTEGMRINSLAQLYDIMDAAKKNVVPRFQILMSNTLYREFENDEKKRFEMFYHVGPISSDYHYQTELFIFEIEYKLDHQMLALIFNRDVVAPYVSEEAKAYDERLREIMDRVIKAGMTDREKVKAVHDYMVVTYKYDVDFEKGLYGQDTYHWYGLLNNGTGVCQAYMELFFMFLAYEDFEVYKVEGWAKGTGGTYEPHGWNVVYVDGVYYHVDVTFDDPVPDQGNKISYKYFLKTSEEMAKDHMW